MKKVIPMEIRMANTGDIPQILELLLQVGEVHHQIRPDIFCAGAQKYDTAALAQLLANPDRPIFAAVDGEKLLGYAFCIHKRTHGDPVLRDSHSLYIDDLCVDETIRGQHVGKALYDAVCAYARSCGCDTITLNVWCGNDRAMAFYEKRGMTPRNIHMEYRLED